ITSHNATINGDINNSGGTTTITANATTIKGSITSASNLTLNLGANSELLLGMSGKDSHINTLIGTAPTPASSSSSDGKVSGVGGADSMDNLPTNTNLSPQYLIDLTNTNHLNTPKASYTTLTIDTLQNLSNARFNVSYNPEASDSADNNQKADHIIILGVANPSGVDTSAAFTPLENTLALYANTNSKESLGDLSSKNILVASVKNTIDSSGKIATSSSGGANDTAGVIFKPVSTVTQGFDDVITTFRTQT
ncbi:hypothetical protein, partial [Helicobacter sp. 11S02596-1]|uniref:hypothetical protein n=1 Tax=Helicobacter sp. 11S02596-1 TaxID=1476194 RepID=UPI0015DE027F